MFLVIIGMVLIGFGMIIYMITTLFPMLRLIGMDYFALFFMAIPYFIALFKISKARCWNQVNGVPMWKHLIKYLRRDNECVELIGTRAYAGESFIDIPLLGLMEYLGKDCNYSSGNGKFVWGLENINFTPDPRYFNLTHLLYELGFADTTDVINVLYGRDLELMGRVYLNMQLYNRGHGAEKLVNDMMNYKGETKVFKAENEHGKIIGFLDKIGNVKKIKVRHEVVK